MYILWNIVTRVDWLLKIWFYLSLCCNCCGDTHTAAKFLVVTRRRSNYFLIFSFFVICWRYTLRWIFLCSWWGLFNFIFHAVWNSCKWTLKKMSSCNGAWEKPEIASCPRSGLCYMCGGRTCTLFRWHCLFEETGQVRWIAPQVFYIKEEHKKTTFLECTQTVVFCFYYYFI